MLSSHVMSTSISRTAPDPGTVSYASLVTPQSPASGLGTSGISSPPEYPMTAAMNRIPKIAAAMFLTRSWLLLSRTSSSKHGFRVVQKPPTI